MFLLSHPSSSCLTISRHHSSSYLTVKTKKALDPSWLKDPTSVRVPELEETDPPVFLTADWLDETMKIALANFGAEDNDYARVPLLGLIRCSRGGKDASPERNRQSNENHDATSGCYFC
jgi:hypothetical protein